MDGEGGKSKMAEKTERDLYERKHKDDADKLWHASHPRPAEVQIIIDSD